MNIWSEPSWKGAKLQHAAHDPASRRHCIDESPLMFHYRLQIDHVRVSPMQDSAGPLAHCVQKTNAKTNFHLHERWMTVHRCAVSNPVALSGSPHQDLQP